VDILPNEIHIRWQDGHLSVFTHLFLRQSCPCALCRKASESPLGPPPVVQNVKALNYAPVGRYALQFFWSDGHSSGIYSFTELRELRPPG
jgi:DUF971 family protein